MISSSSELISKAFLAMRSGFFDLTPIFPHKCNNQSWDYLENINGLSINAIEQNEIRAFTLSLASVLGIKPTDITKCIERACLEKAKQADLEWIKALRGLQCSLQDIPEEERTQNVCRQAIRISAKDFYYVPEPLKSQELCALAMEKEPVMLFFLPLHLQSISLYRQAVSKDGRLITSVPVGFRDEGMYLAAVRENGLSLEYIPSLEITPRIARAAVRSNGLALRHVPSHLVTKSLCDEAIRCEPFGAALPYVPAAFRTKRMVLRVLRKMPLSLAHIPRDEQTEVARKTAVAVDGMAIQFIPMNAQSEEVCHKALANNILCWRYVNPNYLKSGILLSVRNQHHKKFPKNIEDAIIKLVRRKCELSRMMAKAYLSQMEPHEVVHQITITMRRIIALSEIYDGRSLAEMYLDDLRIRGAIFKCSLGV